MHLLPEDIVAQSLLPFLVWRETSALACANKSWALSLRHARDRHSQWKTTTVTGDTARDCVRSILERIGRGRQESLRFAPTFAMATLSFADPQDAVRQLEGAWGDLVDAVVADDVLPVGCALVGLLSGGQWGNDGLPVRTRGDAKVTLTVSVGQLARTTVDAVSFDRKALRWSDSGLTEEIEYPFDDGERGEEGKTSLLAWSTNKTSAEALLSLASQWFPDASVGGAVLPRVDHAPSLMTFTRAAAAPRRAKVQAQRKFKSATDSRVGVLSCPTALLIRLRGDVMVRPLGLCLDCPLTPILKNEALTVVEGDDLMRRDMREYGSVSIIDDANGGSSSQSLMPIVHQYMQRTNGGGGLVTLYSASSDGVLAEALLPEHDAVTLGHGKPVEPIRSVSLYVDRLRMLTIRDHWEVGHYGVVVSRRNAEELRETIPCQIKDLRLRLGQASEVAIASIMLCSTEIDDGSASPLLEVIASHMNDLPQHQCFVDGEIGPITMPGKTNNSPFQLQTGSINGFILSRPL